MDNSARLKTSASVSASTSAIMSVMSVSVLVVGLFISLSLTANSSVMASNGKATEDDHTSLEQKKLLEEIKALKLPKCQVFKEQFDSLPRYQISKTKADEVILSDDGISQAVKLASALDETANKTTPYLEGILSHNWKTMVGSMRYLELQNLNCNFVRRDIIRALTSTAAKFPNKANIRKELISLFESQFQHNEKNSSYLALMIQFGSISKALELGVLKPPQNTSLEEYQKTVKEFIERAKKEAKLIEVKVSKAATGFSEPNGKSAESEAQPNVPAFFEAQKEDWQNSRKLAADWNAFYKLKPLSR